jgi:glycyl-tRNA synthetase
MVYGRDDVVGLDASIIMNPRVWEASGHIEAFTDPLVECKVCHKRFRLDTYEEFIKATQKPVGPVTPKKEYLDAFICSGGGQHPRNQLTEEKRFNLMTEVFLGVTEPKQKTYLRGEITQGVFVNFRNVVDSTRIKIPFGIAQIGKAFRNEITPGNFTYRSREFEQMELEYFIKPDDKEGMRVFNYFLEERLKWYKSLGLRSSHLRTREHEENERAHYARFAVDIEYQAPFGWSEFEGVHHRGDWDLSRHNVRYKAEESQEEFTPWVIETSGGVDRTALFFLIDAYQEEDKRVLLKLHPKLAPVKVAVFPLVANKPQLVKKAQSIRNLLKGNYPVVWDDRGNIGKRYLAQDEIGTPWCVTVDYDTLVDDTVTVRDRDTTKQVRVSETKLNQYFQSKLI